MSEIPEINVGSARLFSVSFEDQLTGDETLTGTPTVVERDTTDLTITNESINIAEITIDDQPVAIGKAVQFLVSGQLAATSIYVLKVSATTTSDPAQTLVEWISFRAVEPATASQDDRPSSVEAMPPLFTSQREIIEVLGPLAASLLTDDADSAAVEDNLWDDACLDATDEIQIRCERWYDPAEMAKNRSIRRWASYLGAYFVTRRRGQPGLYEDQYQRIITILDSIAQGPHKMQVPRLPTRSDNTPAMSNFRVDDRFGIRKIRVQRTISTGGPSVLQDVDPIDQATYGY